MDYGFKFSIGQLLKTVSSLPSKWSFTVDTKFSVVGRQLDECPGGIQRNYACRAVRSDGSTSMELVRFNEIELIESTTFAEDAKAREQDDAKREAASK